MLQGLTPLTPADLTAELERGILPALVNLLHQRSAGHCMRMADLDVELMVLLCARLRAECPQAEVVILGDGMEARTPQQLTVSSTKLVELRNPCEDGTLRPPLLVFLPEGMRTAAEDSFGAATFEVVDLGDVYGAARDRLLAEMPPDVRSVVADFLHKLTAGADRWPFAEPLPVVRYLLTAKINGFDGEAIGASLYELGLAPDFALLADPALAATRIQQNRECVHKLTWSDKSERGRVFDLDLADKTYALRLGAFLAAVGLEDPRLWAQRIVTERSSWDFAFNKWPFVDPPPDIICIREVEIDLPHLQEVQADLATYMLVGQPVLIAGDVGAKFTVRFRVNPIPARVPRLSKFIAQVISADSGRAVNLARSKAAWTTNRDATSINFSRLNRVEWEEGWHFVRISAVDANGDAIPLIDDKGDPITAFQPDADDLRKVNESDRFYVLVETQIEPPTPAQRAVPNHPSRIHAQMHLEFTELNNDRTQPSVVEVTQSDWIRPKPTSRAAPVETLELKFGKLGRVHVPVSSALKAIEQAILVDGDKTVNWRMIVDQGARQPLAADGTTWPSAVDIGAFLAARRRFFVALQGVDSNQISQSADFRSLRTEIAEYAEAYTTLIRDLLARAESADATVAQEALADLRRLLTLDTITLLVRDFRGNLREALLVAPTHPLRALWLTTWAELGRHWLEVARQAPQEYVAATRAALLDFLAPVAFPPVVAVSDGRLMTTVDNLHPFWTLYASADERDPRGLLGEVCAALALPEPAIGSALIDGDYLATRVQRYLAQHPYVSTLVINGFNVGRAAIVADTLRSLQKRLAVTGLCYDVRLFVLDPDIPGVGEALVDLLNGDEDFAASTGSQFRPKLAVSVRSLDEFRAAPERHTAHLTLLLDLFPAEQISVGRSSTDGTAPVHGLVQNFQVRYQETENLVLWQRQPTYGHAKPFGVAEDLTQLLATLPRLLSTAAAASATGQGGMSLTPLVTLTLDSEERALLHQVHEISDWVFILDRNMGIEFFDHGQQVHRPDYLIDHSPDLSGAHGHRLVITSRAVDELHAIIQPVLAHHGIAADDRHAIAILDQLRSLSGRLAFKLISSATQRTEALGLALARLYLEHQGVFTNQIVVPLDAHLDLYRTRRLQADELGEEVSLKRTDLALFDLDAAQRMITCRLVEVKCFQQVGEIGAFNSLKQRIAEQINDSETTLRFHFDPQLHAIDRPDRAVKSRELAMLLAFYLERAERYGIMAPAVASEARYFLNSLEDGYGIRFTRSGLIFDLAKSGADHADSEFGIEYYRIGLNLIEELLQAAAPAETTTLSDLQPTATPSYARTETELRTRRALTASVPTLEKAAFLSPPRDHTVALDERMEEVLATDSESDRGLPFAQASEQTAEPPALEQIDGKVVAATPKDMRHETLAPGAVQVNLRAEPAQSANNGDDPVAPSPPDSTVAVERPPVFDIMLGATKPSPQYGILGEVAGRKVALDLNETQTISLFGVQGGGKSYTLGAIAEMATAAIPAINALPRPLATVIFHYSQTMDYEPEFTSMAAPNRDADQLHQLAERYGASPQQLTDILLLVPADKLDERRIEYPQLEVQPLKFASAELNPGHWRFLMGAVGNQALYLRQFNRVMRSLRNDLSLVAIRKGLAEASLPEHLRSLATDRLNLAAEYIDDSANLSALIRPGRLVIVDLRDEFIEKDEALGLFVVILQLIADATDGGKSFNKLVVFDEAHKYIESPDLVDGLVEVVREMRHKGTSILVASQDPPSVPVALIELSTQIILHKFNSPAWLKHIQKANSALGDLTADKMSALRAGEAYIWSSKATDDSFTRKAVKIRCRPRVTQHGGTTKTAV
jgi:DNA helicase HerA-like ATPase